jgi:hypothetical protein
MAKYVEGNNMADFLLSELDTLYSREAVTFASGVRVPQATVVGKVAFACPATGTAKAGNTGQGIVDGVTAGNEVEIGTYTLKCIEVAAGFGTFKVLTPSGVLLDDALVGTPYVSPHLSFTIHDGAPDFAVGDTFTIAVAKGSEKYKPIDFAARDGSQLAAGVALYDVESATADTSGTIVRRHAVVIIDGLVWPAGATADQKGAALAQLEKLGVLAVTGA